MMKWQWLPWVLQHLMPHCGGEMCFTGTSSSSFQCLLFSCYLHSLCGLCWGQPTAAGEELWSCSFCVSYWAIPAYRTWLWEKSLPDTVGHISEWMDWFSPDSRPGWINMEALVGSKAGGAKEGVEQDESVATQFHLLQKQSSAWRGSTCSGDGNSVSMKKLILFNNLQQDFTLKTSIYSCTRKKSKIAVFLH